MNDVDALVGRELLPAGRALRVGVGDEAGDQLQRVAVYPAELGVDVLDRRLGAGGSQRADGARATLLVEPADGDRRQGVVGRAGLAAGVAQVVRDGLGACPPVAVLAGGLVVGAALVGAVVVLEPLLQPAAASAAAAAAIEASAVDVVLYKRALTTADERWVGRWRPPAATRYWNSTG
jgi:hypothetical protein